MKYLLMILTILCNYNCFREGVYPSSSYKEKYTTDVNENIKNIQIFDHSLKLEYNIVVEKNGKHCGYYAMALEKDSEISYDKIYSLICFDSKDEIKLKNRISLSLEISKYKSDMTTLDDSQILIEYHYINKSQNQILAVEQTGLIDDSTNLFLHAPRGLFLGILAYTSHGSIKHNKPDNYNWESNLYVYDKMINDKEKKEYGFNECSYLRSINTQSMSDQYIPVLNKLNKTIKNNVISTCDKSGLVTETNYYFLKGIGLVKAEYDFYNDVKVKIELLKYFKK